MASNIWNSIFSPRQGENFKAQVKLIFGYSATPLPSGKTYFLSFLPFPHTVSHHPNALVLLSFHPRWQ